MNFLRVRIKSMKHISDNKFDSYEFVHPNQRVIDRFGKKTLYLAQSLFSEAEYNAFNPERSGVVLSTYTGPLDSVKEHADILSSKGYKGINPSRFPNTMLSTALSLVVTALHFRGPSIAMYVDDSPEHALRCATIQLEKGVCDLMMLLIVNENADNFGACLTV